MQRRTFLTVAGGLIAISAVHSLLPQSRALAATWTRAKAWAPNEDAFLALEWRYIAGRVTTEAEDYGFIISLGMHRLPSSFDELLVQRYDFKTGAFEGNTYAGTLNYDTTTATYTFKNASNSVNATIQLNTAATLYRLALSSPKLSLPALALRPQGSVIPETGDGLLSVGRVQGFLVDSDYYADWASIEIPGTDTSLGAARIDMQGLRLAGTGIPAPTADYDHHWFAVAGSLPTPAGVQPVWISAWRIVSGGATYWDITIATGIDTAWATVFKTEADAMAEPLAVRELAWQPIPGLSGGPDTTGASWRISAGVSAPGDLLDMTITVPPGQFAGSARFGGIGTTGFLEEGVGTSATGTVGGQPLSNVRLAVAESTAEFALAYLPLLRR